MSMVDLIVDPQSREGSLERLAGRVLAYLRRHPEVPLPIDHLAQCLDCSAAAAGMAVERLEGPVATPGGRDGYVHLARCSRQAVYIP